MALVVLPTQRLGYAQAPPFVLRQYAQGPHLRVKIVRWSDLEHGLGQHHVPVFIIIVRVPRGVVDGVLELQHASSFLVSELSALESVIVMVHSAVGREVSECACECIQRGQQIQQLLQLSYYIYQDVHCTTARRLSCTVLYSLFIPRHETPKKSPDQMHVTRLASGLRRACRGKEPSRPKSRRTKKK